MFTITSYNDLIQLLTKPINFAKFKLVETTLPVIKGKGFDIIIDDTIRLYFRHQILDYMYDTPTRIGGDIHYKYIYKYIVDKYISRCQRMCSLSEDMRLCIASDSQCGTLPDMNALINTCNRTHTKYCAIIRDHEASQFTVTDQYIIAPSCKEWVMTTANIQYKNILKKLNY